jgi:hypothetical protein
MYGKSDFLAFSISHRITVCSLAFFEERMEMKAGP